MSASEVGYDPERAAADARGGGRGVEPCLACPRTCPGYVCSRMGFPPPWGPFSARRLRNGIPREVAPRRFVGGGPRGTRAWGGTPAGQRYWHFANVPRRGLVQATVPPQSCAATATHHPSRREQGMTHERSSPVIMTKLVAPRLGRGIIDRPRLFNLVSPAQSTRLIVITAPAGFAQTNFPPALLCQLHG